MNNIQIDQICSTDHILKKYYVGVFPANRLPNRNKLKPQCFMIANLDPDTKDGSHWVLLYIRKQTCFYFDSFEEKPRGIIRKYIIKNFTTLQYNRVTAQRDSSIVCGGYLVFKQIS